MQRFPAIASEAMTPEQRAVSDTIASGPRGGVRGPFIALLHNPRLAERVQGLGEHLRFNTGLPPPLLELAILTVGRRWDCAYEWYAHEKIARKAGLAPAIIEALAAGLTPPGMSERETLIHALCSETLRDGQPADATYIAAEAMFGRACILDLLALCGYYSLLAFVLNTAQPVVPDGGATPLAPIAR